MTRKDRREKRKKGRLGGGQRNGGRRRRRAAAARTKDPAFPGLRRDRGELPVLHTPALQPLSPALNTQSRQTRAHVLTMKY